MIIHHIILQHDTIISDHIAILESSVNLLYYHIKAYAMPFLPVFPLQKQRMCKYRGFSQLKELY